MPGVVDRMELRKVSTEADDDSTDSLDDRYTEPIDSEKATIDRSATSFSVYQKIRRLQTEDITALGVTLFNNRSIFLPINAL